MRRQRGVTAIGWVFLLIPMALTIYAGIRVTPVYLNYWRVVEAMNKTATELKNDETLSPATIRSALGKRFDVGYVEGMTEEEIKIAKGGEGWEMTTDYEGVAPLFSNVSLVMAFNKTVVIK
jgi:Domain of unknown function (DUF4845)